jgi:SAM-dependent methyltransferase
MITLILLGLSGCNHQIKSENKMKASWVTLFFVGLADSSSRLRQKLWQWVYDKIAAKDTSGKFIFMNYGYEDDNSSVTLQLTAEDEPFRHFIQLYNFVVKEINLESKHIVEVGCGRGGGGSFLCRYKYPQSYTGIDLSETAINWCKQRLAFANASWLQGYADALPLADNSADMSRYS